MKRVSLMRSHPMQLGSHLVWYNNVGGCIYRSFSILEVDIWLVIGYLKIQVIKLSKRECKHALHMPIVTSSYLLSRNFHHGLGIMPELSQAI